MKTPASFRRVAVIGAGKMGLPIACWMASRGASVIACDRNAALVKAINAGECPFDEPGLAAMLRSAVRAKRLQATTDTANAVATCDTTVVIVPVLLKAGKSGPEADVSALEDVFGTLAKSARPGSLVSLETTVPVGTTRRLAAMLPGAGKDVSVVFSPERVKSRHVLERLGKTPKVVGGLTPACTAKGAAFYKEALGAPVIDVGTLEAAEMTKLADMIYRDVNIALANELAEYARAVGVDFDVVREAANTSGEAHLLIPGVGVGGHCTPVYPWFALQDGAQRGVALPIARAGRETNTEQPKRAVARLEKALGGLKGRRVLILGLAFRPGVKEDTESPAYALREALKAAGAKSRLHDSLYSAEELAARGFEAEAEVLSGWAEAIVLQTAHEEYSGIGMEELAKAGVRVVLDGRDVWKAEDARAAGVTLLGIARG